MSKLDASSIFINNIFNQISTLIGADLNTTQKNEILNYIEKNYKEINGRLYNSYVDEQAVNPYREFTVKKFIERFLKIKPVITGNCTLYKNSKLNGKNVTGGFVRFLKDSRGKYKKERDAIKKKKLENKDKLTETENEKLTALIEMNDSYQSVFKIFANAYYGCIGMKKFIFNDLNSGPAVTGSGVQIITTLIQGFEAFIADNWFFSNFSDILYFLELSKKQGQVDFDYKFDRNISKKELLKRLFSKLKCDNTTLKQYKENYPKIEKKILSVLKEMTQEEVNQAYYRNNLLKFLQNDMIMEDVGTCLEFYVPSGNISDIEKLKSLPENKVLGEKLDRLCKNIRSMVFFNYYFEDRMAFAMRGENKAVIVVDTDSNFLLLDHFFRVIKKYYEIYNTDGTMDPKLRLTIGSIFTVPILFAAEEFLKRYSINHNIDPELIPELNLKNEFFFKRLMLTLAKKNYASLTMSQEGILKDPMELDVKGLALMKSTTAKQVKDTFLNLIENKILRPEYIDINDIIHEYIKFSQEVVDSVKKGQITYCKPTRYGITYKDPFRMEVVRGVVLWNQCMKEKNNIEPLENVNSIKLIGKTEAEFNNIIEKNKNFFNEKDLKKLEEVRKCIFYGNDILKSFGLSVICLPKSEKVLPHWAIPFVDVENMVKNALSPTLIILQSLGIMVDNVGREERFTNIINL